MKQKEQAANRKGGNHKMTNHIFDEDFNYFLEKFGSPDESTPIPELVFTEYQNKLPEQLFSYWRKLGSCSFYTGLFWMVNPADYQDLLESWLEGIPFDQSEDLSVIARSAFGVLYVWSRGKGEILTINPNINVIYLNQEKNSAPINTEEENFYMRCFWAFKKINSIDKTDANEQPLFSRALKKLGKLKSDEMYGFSHRLALGGKETLDNLEIVKLDVYHDLAQQMEPPKIIKI
jgi:hypothetical protein